VSSPKLEYTRRCRIPGCTTQYVSSPLVPIIGQPDPRIGKMIQEMAKHLEKHHPEQFEQGAKAVQQYMTFLFLSVFELQDPLLIQLYECIRAPLHQYSTRATIPDSVIDGKIADLGFEDEDAEGLRTLLRDMRDLLTEQGDYAPQNNQPADKPLVSI